MHAPDRHPAVGAQRAELRSRLGLEIAGHCRHHQPARVAGLRAKRTQLTTMIHTRPMMGETNLEEAPSGAHTPRLTPVVPPSNPRTRAAPPAAKSVLEISPARQS